MIASSQDIFFEQIQIQGFRSQRLAGWISLCAKNKTGFITLIVKNAVFGVRQLLSVL
jgi:hypothetical protein